MIVSMHEPDRLSVFERWWLDAWPHRWHIRSYIPKFLRAAPEAVRGEVLEVGAGRGWTSQRILQTFPQVELTAVDLDPHSVTSLASLQEKYGPRLHIKQADAADLPFDREQFDIVLSVHAMHHFPNVPVVIQELLRVVRPGGLIGIADENQRYVVGPMRWLWRRSNMLDRIAIQQLVAAEAEIVVAHGDSHYYIWARKAYPERLEQTPSR